MAAFSVGASLSYNGSADINSIGGNAGTGNDAGAVTVNASSSASSTFAGYSIVTTGDSSVGILAQSVGGGGGNGGFSSRRRPQYQRQRQRRQCRRHQRRRGQR